MKSQFLIPGLALAVASAYIAPAYTADNPVSLQGKARTAMTAGKWADAVKFIDEAITTYGGEVAYSMGLGDQFGWFPYWKGYSLMQLKKDAEALDAFKDCYTTYKGAGNPYIWISRYREGVCLVNMGKYADGAKILEGFLARRPANDAEAQKVPAEEIQNLLVACYFAADPPQMDKGLEGMKKMMAARYDSKVPVPDAVLINGLKAFSEVAQKQNKVSEVLDFLKSHNSIINMQPLRSSIYASNLLLPQAQGYLNVATKDAEAKDKSMYARLSMKFLGSIPDTAEISTSIKRIESLITQSKTPVPVDGAYLSKDLLESIKKYVEDMNKDHTQIEAYALMLTGSMEMDYGCYRPARAAYRILDERYRQNKNRENTLYQLSALSGALQEMDVSQQYVTALSNEFPTSKHLQKLVMLVIQDCFNNKQYDECIKKSQEAKKMFEEKKTGDEYLGASFFEMRCYYEKQELEQAIALGQSIIELTKKAIEEGNKSDNTKRYLISSQYLSAQCQMRLRNHEEAIKAYTSYITDNPTFNAKDNPFLADAYYERALVSSILGTKSTSEDQKKTLLQNSLNDIQVIEKDFPEHKVYGAAMNLAGAIYVGDPFEDYAKSNEAYEKAYQFALALVQKEGNQTVTNARRVLADALYNIVMNYKDEEQYEKMNEYASKYWKECYVLGTPNAIQIAAAQMKVCDKPGDQFNAAAKQMRDVLVQEGHGNPDNKDLEDGVGEYTTQYLEKNPDLTLDQVKDHFYNFPGVQPNDYLLKALLRMSVIRAYQTKMAQLNKPEQKEERNKISAAIQVFYDELSRDFNLNDLTDGTLMSVGNSFLFAEGGGQAEPKRAIPFFDEILKRDNSKLKAQAESAKAIAMGLSGDPAMIKQAIEMMTTALAKEREAQTPNGEAVDDAMYYLVKFYTADNQADKAIQQATAYLEENHSKHAPEVKLLLGDAYFNKSEWTEAFSMYLSVVNENKGRVSVSAPALLKAMEVLFDKRQKSADSPSKGGDKHLAWTMGESYLKVMRGNMGRMNDRDKQLMYKVEDKVKEYSKDATVLSDEKKIQEYMRLQKAARGEK